MSGEQAAVISAIAAAIAAVVTALIALANMRAATAAKRAAEASVRAAEAAVRSADAAERALELAMRVRWKLTKASDRDWFRLTNEGGTVAHDVRIECESLAHADQPWESIGPGETVKFLATPMFRSDGVDDEKITVLHRLEPARPG